MPADRIGQMITFAAEIDPDQSYSRFVWVKARRNDTVRSIVAGRGHPELAQDVLALNLNADVLPHPKRRPHQKVPPIPRLHTVAQKLRHGAQIRLPGIMTPGAVLNVHAGVDPPVVTGGYANYDVVSVPSRIGISRFLGYDPIQIDIPVLFENYVGYDGEANEEGIAKLERFAGRGDYPGQGVGPPAVLRVSARDASGNVVALIPPDYQWSQLHTNAPLFRISAIAWDAGALRDHRGKRIRATATVSITQFTPVSYVVRSVARRTAMIPSKTGAHA